MHSNIFEGSVCVKIFNLDAHNQLLTQSVVAAYHCKCKKVVTTDIISLLCSASLPSTALGLFLCGFLPLCRHHRNVASAEEGQSAVWVCVRRQAYLPPPWQMAYLRLMQWYHILALFQVTTSQYPSQLNTSVTKWFCIHESWVNLKIYYSTTTCAIHVLHVGCICNTYVLF